MAINVDDSKRLNRRHVSQQRPRVPARARRTTRKLFVSRKFSFTSAGNANDRLQQSVSIRVKSQYHCTFRRFSNVQT